MALKRTVSRILAAAAAPAVLAAAFAVPAPAPAQEGVLHLALGDPERRDREAR